MRFEDERYVRIYTRDTMTMLMLPWEARALFWEILRKVDRAGIIDLGEYGARGLATMVHMPADVVDRQLPELLTAKAVEIRGRLLVVPRFVEAQEAKLSDKARQQAARERARDAARADVVGVRAPAADSTENVTSRDATVTPRDAAVTHSDSSSHGVTARHAASRDVTPSCAVPSRTEPSHAKGGGEATASLPTVPKARSKSEPTSRGTRVPMDFKPSSETIAMFREQGFDCRPHVEEFIDHWCAVSGAKGVKTEWDRTFRNRMRDLISWGKATRWEEPEPDDDPDDDEPPTDQDRTAITQAALDFDSALEQTAAKRVHGVRA